MIGPDVLNGLLDYDPDTGRLFWKYRDDMPKNRNTRRAGMEAFTSVGNHGYRQGDFTYQGKKYAMLAHRAIWAMVTGSWPSGQIDHIDHDRTNNKWANIRECTPRQNLQNLNARGAGTSRFKGVSRYKGGARAHLKWHARAKCADGKKKYIGSFDCEIAAAQAYDRFVSSEHGQFAVLNFPA